MTFWIDEKVEQMRSMWGQGASAGQIAITIGAGSRSAVMGKIVRLGLSREPGARPLPAIRIRIKRDLAKPVPVTKPMPPEPRRDEPAKMIPFLSLKPRHCREPMWPHDRRPGPLEQYFCGCDIDHGSYCLKHSEQNHIPRAPRS